MNTLFWHIFIDSHVIYFTAFTALSYLFHK
ncbi:hypothetical protein D3Z63_19395 [Vibrio parahaemolyticus]|uniref:Uncharacterized protein n=1 Tax=Vibrio parahaemolyticus TaxID=670 RepID=A0A2R9VIL0_VIBPH|nr:hypothetical protein RK51_004230 [Vibrio parahaemolyticus]QGG32408.1 hypothetical protein GH799_04550 [Vibrio parahaemolyticus 10329]AVW96438.1 hypothetical protein DA442_15880 [Vibrio parahaemolyticus]AWA87635.1 hypothetical protein BSG32_00425 [Vibrio parahaemolyticus]AWG77472.1 hypothetical protein C9I78_00810 [Vibrio parahaemolyticus]